MAIFSSEKFHHDNAGEHVVDINGQKVVRYKEVIFYADKFKQIDKSILSKCFILSAEKNKNIYIFYIYGSLFSISFFY